MFLQNIYYSRDIFNFYKKEKFDTEFVCENRYLKRLFFLLKKVHDNWKNMIFENLENEIDTTEIKNYYSEFMSSCMDTFLAYDYTDLYSYFENRFGNFFSRLNDKKIVKIRLLKNDYTIFVYNNYRFGGNTQLAYYCNYYPVINYRIEKYKNDMVYAIETKNIPLIKYCLKLKDIDITRWTIRKALRTGSEKIYDLIASYNDHLDHDLIDDAIEGGNIDLIQKVMNSEERVLEDKDYISYCETALFHNHKHVILFFSNFIKYEDYFYWNLLNESVRLKDLDNSIFFLKNIKHIVEIPKVLLDQTVESSNKEYMDYVYSRETPVFWRKYLYELLSGLCPKKHINTINFLIKKLEG